MSGATVPANVIVEPFGTGASDPDYITLPIPVASQISVTPGAASFADGFPPATMSDPETEGGVPPFGQDINGILYMCTAYLALIQAGQRCTYNADAVAAFGGYAIGAQLDSVATPGRIWTNYLDGNAADPDADPTGWAANEPLGVTVAPAAGGQSNVALPGASDYIYDIDTSAGAVNYSGFVAQRDGQTLYITNAAANALTLLALNGGSAAANQIRAATDLGLIMWQTLTIKWSSAINKWVAI